MTQLYDIVICGSGSAAVCAAAYLSRCGITSYKVLEKRPGPLAMGQADGVQCRTVEIYDSLGIAEEVIREAYHVYEVIFWESDDHGGIRRAGRTIDTEPGLSHMPHVILNQARMNGLLIETARKYGGPEVDYGWQVKSVQVDRNTVEDPQAHCVSVSAERDGSNEIFKAKYVLACDGAHSSVRSSLGFKMVGDSTDAIWGVVDFYPQTGFPDIRRKCTIRSDSGAVLIIPREGGSLVRFYIELPDGTKAKEVKIEDLQATAKKIFQPYSLEFSEVVWWSAYAIGQRLADNFHESYRVFLTGDACHTHSPKAGQGMNVSMQDGYNISWKLAQVLKGHATPNLLKTYVLERQKVAADLIAFDRHITKMWSSKAKEQGYTPKDFSDAFIKSGRFMAGMTATYQDSMVTSVQHSKQDLAKNIIVGMRFPNAQVVRFCDAKPVQLQSVMQSDGRWRIIVFAGDVSKPDTIDRLDKLGAYLSSPKSPIKTFTPSTVSIDSFIEPLLVLSDGHRASDRVARQPYTPAFTIDQEQIPEIFWPVSGKWGVRDLHKTYLDTESYNSGCGMAYETYGVGLDDGAIVIVRPDQYVSLVTTLDDYDGIGQFFAGFAVAPPPSQEGCE